MKSWAGSMSRLDISFRFRPSRKTPDGILLNYIKEQEHSTISHEMILKALRAFWLLDAYQESGFKKGQELRKLAQGMILVLEAQASYLRTIFGIERQEPVYQVLSQSVPSQSPVLRPQEEEEDTSYWDSIQRLDTGGL